MKLQWAVPALVVAGVLGLLAILMSWFQISISLENDREDAASLPVVDGDQSLRSPATSATTVALSEPSTVATASQAEVADATVKLLDKTASRGSQVAALRMSNQTDQPIRLALLARRSGTAGIPAHWDFDPQEGSEKGLLLSLPEGKLKLETGDIVVAFAQDGSRRYWGPYVLGETRSPVWNAKATEWELILK